MRKANVSKFQIGHLQFSQYQLITIPFLSVSDAPEIEQEETFIHTGEGDETEVICVVHSSPKADVSWFKVGALIKL